LLKLFVTAVLPTKIEYSLSQIRMAEGRYLRGEVRTYVTLILMLDQRPRMSPLHIEFIPNTECWVAQKSRQIFRQFNYLIDIARKKTNIHPVVHYIMTCSQTNYPYQGTPGIVV